MSEKACCCGAEKPCGAQTVPKGPERRKPLLRIVCPVCGVMIWVNALDRAGRTENKCRSCGGLVWIETDDEGYIIDIQGVEPEVEKKPESFWQKLLGDKGPLVLIGALVLMFFFFKACGPTAPSKAYEENPPGVTKPENDNGGVKPTPSG